MNICEAEWGSKIIQGEKQKYRNWYSKFTGKNLLVFIKICPQIISIEAGTRAFIEWWENAPRLFEEISFMIKNINVPIKKSLFDLYQHPNNLQMP